eukprot:GHVU01168099.1.p2 GENE.GHVU01168099.1~~GHVU01168099.1.p2  ORF type:complete len:128 (-),score=5.51 GHVU01168099.1:71-454(-)
MRTNTHTHTRVFLATPGTPNQSLSVQGGHFGSSSSSSSSATADAHRIKIMPRAPSVAPAARSPPCPLAIASIHSLSQPLPPALPRVSAHAHTHTRPTNVMIIIRMPLRRPYDDETLLVNNTTHSLTH